MSEYGSTLGIITMDDVVDALVGDATEMDQEEYQITPRDENTWFVDGQYSVLEFIKYFDIPIEEDYSNQFTTVAGLIIHKNSSLPNVGDRFSFGNYELEIIDKDRQRIDKILVTKKWFVSVCFIFTKHKLPKSSKQNHLCSGQKNNYPFPFVTPFKTTLKMKRLGFKGSDK